MHSRLFGVVALVASTLLIAAAPASAARSIKGKWRGPVAVVKGGSGSFLVAMKITRLTVGKRAGRVSNPEGPCKGPITLTKKKAGRYTFQYREASGSSRCTGDDRITVHRKGPTLRWRGVSPDGKIVGKGILARP